MTPPTPLRPLIVLALLGLAPATAQQRPLDGFDAYVAKSMADWRVPGLAIVVVKNDSVVFIKGYGVRELGKPDPVTVHTRFGNMSTTKAFTAMLVAMLGDPDYLWGNSGLDFATITHRLRFVPVQTSFRTRFQYNNVTYALAGDVAAHAAGTPWQSLLHARILGPLGMTETLADASELRGISDVTAPHGIVRDTVRVLPAALDGIDDIAPAGAIFSTATDMAKWLRFVLDSGKVAGRRLVSAPNFAELFRPQQIVQRPFYPTARLTHPHFQAYGLGWILQDYRGEFIAMHTGSIEGRSAIVGLIPDRRLGLAISRISTTPSCGMRCCTRSSIASSDLRRRPTTGAPRWARCTSGSRTVRARRGRRGRASAFPTPCRRYLSSGIPGRMRTVSTGRRRSAC